MKSTDKLKLAIKQQEETKKYLSDKLDKLKVDKIKLQESYSAALLEDVKKSEQILLEIKGLSVEIDTVEEQLSALQKDNPALQNIGKEIYLEGYSLTQDLKENLTLIHESIQTLKEVYENELKELTKKETDILYEIDNISQEVFNHKKYMSFIPNAIRTPIQLNLKNINLLEVEKTMSKLEDIAIEKLQAEIKSNKEEIAALKAKLEPKAQEPGSSAIDLVKVVEENQVKRK
ncbi:hypothetical protein [Haloimpatiens lingqiaonensis]|uniref:hypothetical protein n=2 Tax=Haloimpatiens lingqiaonensis TaxID=1380675 RepID=UPI0037C029F5